MDTGLLTRMNECSDLVRSLEGQLGRLEKHFRSAFDAALLPPKQTLLNSATASFHVRHSRLCKLTCATAFAFGGPPADFGPPSRSEKTKLNFYTPAPLFSAPLFL